MEVIGVLVSALYSSDGFDQAFLHQFGDTFRYRWCAVSDCCNYVVNGVVAIVEQIVKNQF